MNFDLDIYIISYFESLQKIKKNCFLRINNKLYEVVIKHATDWFLF